jgi:DsbC/DsbD-like thiol-disulfide interchange protein
LKKRLLLLPIFLLCAASSLPAWAASQHVKIELLCEQASIQPGGIVNLGVRFKIKKGWHIYWQNPGDSGQPPSITWNLPEGFSVGEIQWPIPQRLPLSKLADYGYKNEVLLIVPLKAPDKIKHGHMVRLSAKVRWLVCQEICLPGDAQANLRIPVRKRVPALNTRNQFLFKSARKNLPSELPEGWRVNVSLGAKEFHLSAVTGSNLSKSASALFFPLHPNMIENAPAQAFKASGSSFSLSLKRSDQLPADVKNLEGLLVVKEKDTEKGYWINALLSGN